MIKGKKVGFYCGTNFPTRHEAIALHEKRSGWTWKQCYRRGDRAVKVVIGERACP